MGNGSGVSRGDRNRNARLARLRGLVPVSNAIVGVDLAGRKQMVVVCDHDSKVLARKTFRCRAWDLGAALDCDRDHLRREPEPRERRPLDLGTGNSTSTHPPSLLSQTRCLRRVPRMQQSHWARSLRDEGSRRAGCGSAPRRSGSSPTDWTLGATYRSRPPWGSARWRSSWRTLPTPDPRHRVGDRPVLQQWFGWLVREGELTPRRWPACGRRGCRRRRCLCCPTTSSGRCCAGWRGGTSSPAATRRSSGSSWTPASVIVTATLVAGDGRCTPGIEEQRVPSSTPIVPGRRVSSAVLRALWGEEGNR